MATTLDWSAFLDVGVGLGVFLIGVAFLVFMSSAARTIRRVEQTLDAVDEQIGALGKPASETLAHVGGIADTADQVIGKLTGVVASLESVSSSLAQTAKLTQEAVSPTIVNVGATLGGITAGLRRIVRGQNGAGEST